MQEGRPGERAGVRSKGDQAAAEEVVHTASVGRPGSSRQTSMSLLLQMDSWLAVEPNRCTWHSGQRLTSAERTASSASCRWGGAAESATASAGLCV